MRVSLGWRARSLLSRGPQLNRIHPPTPSHLYRNSPSKSTSSPPIHVWKRPRGRHPSLRRKISYVFYKFGFRITDPVSDTYYYRVSSDFHHYDSLEVRPRFDSHRDIPLRLCQVMFRVHLIPYTSKVSDLLIESHP